MRNAQLGAEKGVTFGMKIVIDAMGGDHAPVAIVEGALKGANEIGVELILCGRQSEIEAEVDKYKNNKAKITIIHCEEVITNDDDPVRAVRRKKDASIVRALEILKDGKADALVSAGSTGALFAGSVLILGRLANVMRPALMPVLPTDTGCTLLLDGGANTDCKPEYLYQFAVMGNCYAQKMLDIKSPRIGLVNVGTEDSKGTDLTRGARALLSKSNMNFIGNMEARDIPTGGADVAVTDGFTGNIILKFMEGMGKTFSSNMKDIFMSSFTGKVAALLVMKKMKLFKKKLDYTEHGGAPLLGVDGAVIKAHGSSNAKAFYNALRQAEKYVRTGVLKEIRDHLNQDNVILEEVNHE